MAVDVITELHQGIPSLNVLTDISVFLLSMSEARSLFWIGALLFWLSQFIAMMSMNVYAGNPSNNDQSYGPCAFCTRLYSEAEESDRELEKCVWFHSDNDNCCEDLVHATCLLPVHILLCVCAIPCYLLIRLQAFILSVLYFLFWTVMMVLGYLTKIIKCWCLVLEPCATCGLYDANHGTDLAISSVHPLLWPPAVIGQAYRDYLSPMPWYLKLYRVYGDSFGGYADRVSFRGIHRLRCRYSTVHCDSRHYRRSPRNYWRNPDGTINNRGDACIFRVACNGRLQFRVYMRLAFG